MSSSQDDDGFGGCFALFGGLLVLGLVLQYWLQILTFCLAIAVVTMIVMALGRSAREAAERADQRRRCTVCQSWSGSVLLTELPARSDLCPSHSARQRRIASLEGELFD